MSHAKIIQLSTQPIAERDYVTPEDYYDAHDAYADWIGDAEEGDTRKECIANLVKYSLSGLFEFKDGCLVYLGADVFLKNWVDAIHEKAQAITVENVTFSGPRSALRDILLGSHTNGTDRVVLQEWTGICAEPVSELVGFAFHNMKPGDKLYIGAVIDFHY